MTHKNIAYNVPEKPIQKVLLMIFWLIVAICDALDPYTSQKSCFSIILTFTAITLAVFDAGIGIGYVALCLITAIYLLFGVLYPRLTLLFR